MSDEAAEPVLIVSPRYADEVAASVAETGMVPRIERRPERAAERFEAEPVRLVVVDARGALAPGMAAARALGTLVKARQGALLLLLSRVDGDATAAGLDAGATSVLVSPFGSATFGSALRLAARHARRLADAALPGVDGEGVSPERRKRSDLLTGLATGDQLQAWVAAALNAPDGAGPGPQDEARASAGVAPGPGAEALPGRDAVNGEGRIVLAVKSQEEKAVPAQVFVLQIGVGRFATINAAYGRAVADRVLTSVALRLGQIVVARQRGQSQVESRLLARLAAAEFGVGVAGAVDMEEVMSLANDLARAFEAPFHVDGHVIHLSARLGIAAATRGHVTGCDSEPRDDAPADATADAGARMSTPVVGAGPIAEVGAAEDGAADEGAANAAAALIRRASAALAQARAGEAGAIAVFQMDPEGDPLRRMADLESDLHRAIESDDIAVLFQPQLTLSSGRITGVEALVRWDHPELGLLPAETLLGTAASAELAIRLGRHIRLRAMQFAASWTGALARLRLSVNVTAADLADPGFVAALETGLTESGRLTLEVTEGALIDDMFGAVQLLSDLRQSGLRVALDDFGTGYSSLAWMARLPVDIIKLDRSFTLGLTGSPRERVVVETMVRLSKQLGLMVIAEGVEDDVQLDAARLAGCDAVQGFRVAPALNVSGLLGFCESWQVDEMAG